ncbi:uncharacterized protein fkbp16 isoform X2 [Cyclopterus lumpus]|uniref:uncharacterized protein fkbp16 isoform X2 n=1 Tax=Cyclopterus lumpus TaxID=8103 RepID=UPI00148631CB|nr:uncharacterized protein fkbp16 isoform X2 [Cyclopterus lumpus]
METEPSCEEHEHPVEPTVSGVREVVSKLAETESCAGVSKSAEVKQTSDSEQSGDTGCKERRTLKKTNSWKMVRFQDPSTEDDVLERDSSAESLFPEYVMTEWTSSTFEELFVAEDWLDIAEDQLLRKKVVEFGAPHTLSPTWGQAVTVKMQCVLEDRTVVEKDCKLVFVIGEGDVNQALEECVMSMQKGEITLLLADSLYAYGLLGRDPAQVSEASALLLVSHSCDSGQRLQRGEERRKGSLIFQPGLLYSTSSNCWTSERNRTR